MTATATKPLGRKAYGSIGHLPSSRLGPGDYSVHEGQARILTEKTRDKHDRVIVQEKLDGSCVAVANVEGDILALGRAGYLASTSPFEQHHMFADWVGEREPLFNFLAPGERLVGEWLALAHGTRYDISEAQGPFRPFDIMRDAYRVPFDEFRARTFGRLAIATVLCDEPGPVPLDAALACLGKHGFSGAIDPAEGVVYRVERRGEVDFLAKYVRAHKVDGWLLPEVSGEPAVWNWRPL